MPRQPKPFFRKQTKSWYCSINGWQISLGKDRELAQQKFHQLMHDREAVTSEIVSIYGLSQTYLTWCLANRSKLTYDKHKLYIKSFVTAVGKRLKVGQLKQNHFTTWTAEHPDWTDNSKNDAICTVQRMLNWAVEEGYLARSPVAKVKKPRRTRRDVVYTEDQWEAIMSHLKGPIADLLNFLSLTGCRPKEARCIEARHCHDDLIIFPADESKGETEGRVIFMPPEAKAILDRLEAKNPQGPIFRNTRGNAWTKDAIKCQLTRVSEKVGFRVLAYATRHTFVTNALTQGGIDPVSLSHLLGHKDTAMVSRVYSHLAKNPDFLREQARKAIEKRKPKKPNS